jgi:hypothetical protein
MILGITRRKRLPVQRRVTRSRRRDLVARERLSVTHRVSLREDVVQRTRRNDEKLASLVIREDLETRHAPVFLAQYRFETIELLSRAVIPRRLKGGRSPWNAPRRIRRRMISWVVPQRRA